MTEWFTVHLLSLRQGLPPTTTMRDLAADVAAAIRHEFDGPVPLEQISTGGSIAQHSPSITPISSAGWCCCQRRVGYQRTAVQYSDASPS